MGIRISQMDPLGVPLEDADMMEITKKTENKTYSITPKHIAEYMAKKNNSMFRGELTKNWDEITAEDVGVYRYSGEAPISGLQGEAIVEVYSYQEYKATDSSKPGIIVRYNTDAGPFERANILGTPGGWGEWYDLANKNSNVIDYGQDSGEEKINFNVTFNDVPSVVVTPVAPTSAASDYVYLSRVTSVDSKGFSVVTYRSSTAAVVVTEKSNTKETSSEKTTETTTETTFGAWERVTDAVFNWIATLEKDSSPKKSSSQS